jgi:hypothetical protein
VVGHEVSQPLELPRFETAHTDSDGPMPPNSSGLIAISRR